MLIFVLILLAAIFVDIKSAGKNEFFDDYCAPKQTSSINGIFVVLVFFSHASQALKLGGALDTPYVTLRGFLGQLVVVTFLFYSGYGMTESIKKKGHKLCQKYTDEKIFQNMVPFCHSARILYSFVPLHKQKLPRVEISSGVHRMEEYRQQQLVHADNICVVHCNVYRVHDIQKIENHGNSYHRTSRRRFRAV